MRRMLAMCLALGLWVLPVLAREEGEAAPAPWASPSVQMVTIDGMEPVEFQMYALGSGSTNYIRLRDLAMVLSGTAARFEVEWDGAAVSVHTGRAYTGSAEPVPYRWDMLYEFYTEPTSVDGRSVELEAIRIPFEGKGYTYYKLRDLGAALGFNVGWTAQSGIFVNTQQPYDPAD